jgi:hypothetical protein
MGTFLVSWQTGTVLIAVRRGASSARRVPVGLSCHTRYVRGVKFPPAFYRTAAVFSMLSALTTLGLIFLPRMFAPIEGFEGRMGRVHDDWYQLRAWIYLLHPFLTGTAGLAICLRIRQTASTTAVVGAAGFAIWAFTEALQQCFTLFAFDQWRLAYTAGDAAIQAQMPTLTTLYDEVWDAFYVLLLIGFMIGNGALGSTFVRGRGLTRAIGVFFLLAVLLTLFYFLPELGIPVSLGPLDAWVYPVTQPLARVLIGVWLWRHAVEAQVVPDLLRA